MPGSRNRPNGLSYLKRKKIKPEDADMKQFRMAEEKNRLRFLETARKYGFGN